MKRPRHPAQPDSASSAAGPTNERPNAGDRPDGYRDTREMICISCPIGCRLTVCGSANDQILVTGNKCARGREYGEEEYRAPKRMVTCTCRTNSDRFPRLPVRSVAAVPKELIDDLLHELYALTVELPVRRGDPVLRDFRNSGVDVVATATLHG